MPLPRATLAVARRRLLLAGAGAAVLSLVGCRERGAAEPAAKSPMAEAEFERAARRGELCSTANATGMGLRGEYFARDLGEGEPLLVRTDGTIDFDASLEWPLQRATQRPRAARWRGWIKPPITGRYRFHTGQDGARVVVAGQPMGGDGATAGSGIELAAGRFYPITLEVNRLDSLTGRLRLEWTAPYGARYLIPRALLFLPSESVAPKKL